MSSSILFLTFIPLLSLILLGVNLIFAPHYPYKEKDNVFECGFNSFLGQNRTQFSISFFIFALLFLLFDLEILLVYPYIVSAYINDIYGLLIMLIFFIVLTLGFAFELGKKALNIESKQQYNVKSGKDNRVTRDKITLPFNQLVISKRHFSTLPTIFKLAFFYIKKAFLFISSILFLYLITFIPYFIFLYTIIGIFELIDITQIYLYCKIIKYLFRLISIKQIAYHLFFIIIIIFYTFGFNRILKHKHIIKLLSVEFAYKLTKTKIRDIFLYLITFITYFLFLYTIIGIDITQIYLDCKFIKYLFRLISIKQITYHYIIYTLIFLFYIFCFNKILTSRHIIKFLPVEFASRLTVKTKIRDIFLYFFSIKFVKYVILCGCFITIPFAVKLYLTGCIFYSSSSLFDLIFVALYVSIILNIVSCFLNNKKYFCIDNLCSIIYIFCIIFCAKLTLGLIICIPLLMGDLNIGNNVNKAIVKNLNEFPKLLDKLPIINKLNLSK